MQQSTIFDLDTQDILNNIDLSGFDFSNLDSILDTSDQNVLSPNMFENVENNVIDFSNLDFLFNNTDTSFKQLPLLENTLNPGKMLHTTQEVSPALTFIEEPEKIQTPAKKKKVIAEDEEDKPPHTYSYLITCAIWASDRKMMTLNEIYTWFLDNYTYFRTTKINWKNSIRHNLSKKKLFVKVPRPVVEFGKGCYWTLNLDASSSFSEELPSIFFENSPTISNATLYSPDLSQFMPSPMSSPLSRNLVGPISSMSRRNSHRVDPYGSPSLY